MSIDRRLVLEEERFVRPVRDRHDVDVAKFRSGLAPVTMGQNLMPPDFAARLHFASRRHGPMKERVETRHPHSAGRRLHVLEKRGESPNDFAFRQILRDREKFLQRNARFLWPARSTVTREFPPARIPASAPSAPSTPFRSGPQVGRQSSAPVHPPWFRARFSFASRDPRLT